MGGALAVLLWSIVGMPVSTSHCLIGSLVGQSIADQIIAKKSKLKSLVNNKLNYSILKKIVFSWIITIPISMVVTLIYYYGFILSVTD